MEIRDRIQQRLSELGLKAATASSKAGLHSSYLRKFLAGDIKDITTAKLDALAVVLQTSPEWLRSGAEPGDKDDQLAEVEDIWEHILDRDERSEAYGYIKGLAARKNKSG